MKLVISVFTATRAEFGLLSPLIRDILADGGLELQLVVSGAHLCRELGGTVEEIEAAHFPVAARIDILPQGAATPSFEAVSVAIRELSLFWQEQRPNIVIILGDRYEAFAAASAAAMASIPIAHIGGGDVSAGAKDEFFRHCITKMSALHFPICKSSARRLLRLGEAPASVFECGSLGSQNIKEYSKADLNELKKRTGIDPLAPFLLCTCHSETLGALSAKECIESLLAAISEIKLPCIFTAANADEGGEEINRALEAYCEGSENAVFIKSLGLKLYLTALRSCAAVVGNSSSGIVEAPVLGKPCVNIGDRQRSREAGENTLNCSWKKDEIVSALHKALSPEFAKKAAEAESPYKGDDVSGCILANIKAALERGIDLKKEFYEGEQVE